MKTILLLVIITLSTAATTAELTLPTITIPELPLPTSTIAATPAEPGVDPNATTPAEPGVDHKASAPLDAGKQDNATIHKITEKLCPNCNAESIEFLYAQNLVRAKKKLPPFEWDTEMENYAKSWGGKRKQDCQLKHSFEDGEFKFGECIYLGGSGTPTDAVNMWADEEKYYTYETNSCEAGQACGHYTQIVWKNSKKLGCARVVCDNGEVFMTCNYNPPGNVIGEKPY